MTIFYIILFNKLRFKSLPNIKHIKISNRHLYNNIHKYILRKLLKKWNLLSKYRFI